MIPSPPISEAQDGGKQTSPERRHHPRFHFPDGNVIFLVEDVLFKVHRYFFQRDSAIFSSMFSLPQAEGERSEGEIEEKPIILTGIYVKDFETFLMVLYPIDFLLSELNSPEEWVSVLKIATQWEFASIRRLSIDCLSKNLATADRVAIGKCYDVQQWLVPAYTDLCIREQPLGLNEGQKLGMEDVIEIYRIRSLIRYNSNLNRRPDTIGALVKQEFMG
ncbi:hypothetical protein BDZ97DRAFT_1758440 [Flammula alnicola]|nr:hypothetical protein BDZ97DRAFT_1758440 [Flammula alnicola]